MKELVEYLGNLVNFNPAQILLWRLSQFNDRPTQSITDSQGKVRKFLKAEKWRNEFPQEILRPISNPVEIFLGIS